jgi:hypothetical protein
MALRLSTDLKNYIVNQGIIKQMCGTMGTGGTASLTIYSGTQPATGGGATSGTSGTVLCQIINIGWGGTTGDASTIGSTSGTIGFAAAAGGYTGTAVATGTAGWARLQTVGTGFTGSAATFCIDGDVGTASTSTFVINSVSITNLGAVTILSCPISI